jgi:hypothetical protein
MDEIGGKIVIDLAQPMWSGFWICDTNFTSDLRSGSQHRSPEDLALIVDQTWHTKYQI